VRQLLSALCVLAIAPTALFAQTNEPLSVIDWLSDSVTDEQALGDRGLEPPTATSARPPDVLVTQLDMPTPDSVGLFPESTLDLPNSMWSLSEETSLVELVSDLPDPKIPVLQDLLVTLLLIQSDPPFGATPRGRFFLSRVDKLLELGRLEEAGALLSATDLNSPEIFRRQFDVSLLTGTEDEACRSLSQGSSVAPSYAARIYCLAREGDWPAAALTLNTRRVLGDLSDDDDLLFSLFLDPEFFDHSIDLPEPERVTPLIFRIREAVGESLSTVELPLAFAHADLRSINGWKTQLDAAERLARNGAIEPNVLKALFTTRRPSASGGVWDKVAALQTLQAALDSGRAGAVETALPSAFESAQEMGAEALFSEIYSNEVSDYDLSGEAAEIAATMMLLSPNADLDMSGAKLDPFLVAVAQGRPQEVRATEPRRLAIQAAFNGATPPQSVQTLLDGGRTGEAILEALHLTEAGLDGDLNAMRDAITILRTVGLEDIARKASLQFLILERL